MDLTGRKLGKYELIELLGQGGMAQVYKARQPLINRLVAIKVMLPYLENSTKFLERFLQEAQRLGQLRHPNIVSVLDFDNLDGTQFIVMDYISGPSLRGYLSQKVRLAPQEALRIAVQILDALQYAHEKGVVHCDLNPANVMFLDNTCRQVVLTDFGIARMMDASGQAQNSTVIGTPAYMSPEALDGSPFDGRTDLYALGVMLYEMVTGDQPYKGDTPVSVILKHMQAPLPDLSKTHPNLPAGFAQLVEKAMAKEPGQRFSNAIEMRRAIVTILRSLNATTSAGVGDETVTLRTATLTSPQPTIPPVVPSSMPTLLSASQPVQPGLTNQPVVQPVAPQVSPGVRRPSNRMLGLGLGLGLAALAIIFVLTIAVLALVLGRDGQNVQAATIPTSIAETAVIETSPVVGIQTEPTNPAILPTTVPETTIAPQDIPLSEANRTGSVNVMVDKDGKPAYLLARIEPAPQPPSGSEYVLWIGDGVTTKKLGSPRVQDGRAQLLTPVDSATLGILQQAMVTLEPQGGNLTAPAGPTIYSGQFSPGRLAEFRQLALASSEVSGKPYIWGILDQLLAVNHHQIYAYDALKNGDLKMGRAHAEHAINVLEGKNGEHFGDADGNGSVENPGDDVGLPQYISQARLHILAAAAADPQTRLRQSEADGVATQLDTAMKNVQDLISLNVQLLATNDDAQRLSLAEQGDALMQKLLFGEDGLGGLWATGYAALQVVDLPLIGGEGQPGQTASGATGSSASAAGWIRLGENNEVTMQFDGIPVAPTGYSYALWAVQDAAGQSSLVGQAQAGEYELHGQAPADLYTSYNQVQLSLESEHDMGVPQEPTRVIMSGALIPSTGRFLSKLTTPPDQAPWAKAEEQVKMAQEHMLYLQQALDKNDLALAKRHAEHIVNILEGEGGKHYGDFNGDGNIQNPGDPVGVLGYLKQIEAQAQQLSADNLTATQRLRLDQMLRVESGTIDLIDTNSAAASKIIASDTVNEARSNAQSLAALVQAVLTGMDSDNNGVIDPLTGEGGLQAIRELAAALGEIELFVK